MKRNIIVCLCLLASMKISAQTEINRLLVSAFAESTLTKGMEYGVGVGYVLPIKGASNVGFGLYYGMAKHSLESDDFSYTFSTVDDEGDEMDYKAHGTGVKERQTFNLLEIPVYYQFRTKNIFVNFGPQIAIPIKAEYNTTAGDVELTGYYPKYNVELENLPNHGFGKYDVAGNHGDLESRVTFGVNAAVGYCYPLGTMDINVSVYAKFLMNGYVNDASYLEYPNGVKSLSYVEGKQHLFSFGLSVGVGL